MKDRWSFNYSGSRIIILSKGKIESYENSTGKHFFITTTNDRFYILIITGRRIRKRLTDNIIKSILMVKPNQITFAPLSMLVLMLKDEVFKEILKRINTWTD